MFKFLALSALGVATARPLGLSEWSGICTGQEITVTPRVLSGTKDPSWTLTAEEADVFCRTAGKIAQTDAQAAPSGRVLGYKWFEVASADAGEDYLMVGRIPELEAMLLSFGADDVQSTIIEHIADVVSTGNNGTFVDYGPQEANSGSCQDKVPVIGLEIPIYDPSTDCEGCFVSDCSLNNCYAYGNDIVTDTFPQPGRGSGQEWSENTCDDMRAAAERDGLVWAGTDTPTGPPADGGHYVMLMIWPGTNFHWARQDDSGDFWSQKPGGTPVTNLDNAGNTITDPKVTIAQGGFDPWSEFCGFMITDNQKVTIN